MGSFYFFFFGWTNTLTHLGDQMSKTTSVWFMIKSFRLNQLIHWIDRMYWSLKESKKTHTETCWKKCLCLPILTRLLFYLLSFYSETPDPREILKVLLGRIGAQLIRVWLTRQHSEVICLIETTSRCVLTTCLRCSCGDVQGCPSAPHWQRFECTWDFPSFQPLCSFFFLNDTHFQKLSGNPKFPTLFIFNCTLLYCYCGRN